MTEDENGTGLRLHIVDNWLTIDEGRDVLVMVQPLCTADVG